MRCLIVRGTRTPLGRGTGTPDFSIASVSPLWRLPQGREREGGREGGYCYCVCCAILKVFYESCIIIIFCCVVRMGVL